VPLPSDATRGPGHEATRPSAIEGDAMALRISTHAEKLLRPRTSVVSNMTSNVISMSYEGQMGQGIPLHDGAVFEPGDVVAFRHPSAVRTFPQAIEWAS